jgi:NhaP-type Na+/H+ or K+/H+ antiporter
MHAGRRYSCSRTSFPASVAVRCGIRSLGAEAEIPHPIVLVIGGLLLSFIAGIPRVVLNPDVVFFVSLPPLLYSAAWLTSWREFSYNLVSIFILAFGLVTFTVFGVTQAGQWFLPGFDWRIGLVLGGVVDKPRSGFEISAASATNSSATWSTR